jgi:hypothetical protein
VLDLTKLDTGNGEGKPSVQGIINSINSFYGVPQNKVQLGNLNNIQLVSDSQTLPNSLSNLAFDFNLNNISAKSANFYVTGVTVQDAAGATMPNTSTIPVVALDPTNTYRTTAGSATVTISTPTVNSFTPGQVVYLSTPPAGPDVAGTYDGIPPASLGGYFTITNVTTTSFDIAVNPPAVLGSTYAVAGQTATPPYAAAATGGDTRTKSKGLFTADLSTSPGSQFYTVTADVGVDDGSGNVVKSQISYRVFNNQAAAKNTVFGARTATNPATIVPPTNLSPRATAKLVDANGVELPKVGGQYLLSNNGYLKIETTSGSSFLAIDSLDSQELGKPNSSPSEPGSKRGFAHYFNLNDFFKSNATTPTGDTQFGSANNLKVEDRLTSNNSLLSVGNLSLGNSTVALDATPNYTYQLNPGDNTTVAKWAQIASKSSVFPPNGGLGATTQTITGYIGQVIGGIATNASNAGTTSSNAQALLTSYQQQSSAISGVNLDTELANTVIYQNAYAASARVITVTNQLFDALLQSVG